MSSGPGGIGSGGGGGVGGVGGSGGGGGGGGGPPASAALTGEALVASAGSVAEAAVAWLGDEYRSLSDVVRGIRACKRDVSLYISQVIAEIKVELQSTSPRHKANAVQKLTFLQMMGYNVSDWSSFAIIEVMSSPVFAHKRIGYLAASQTFTPKTQVILLATNLLQKELRGSGGRASLFSASSGTPATIYQTGLAINCISNIVTEELARELLPDLERLLSHPNPYLRKKAVLCLYKVFLRWPQALRLEFSKIQSILETDSHPAVVSCAVNVITELSTKNPNNYLPLAPSFFQLLTSSTNNWMLIKVVKLLGSLVPEEPRLARKLLEPLAQIVKTTQAKSLLYEAVYTITLCMPYCVKADGSRPAIIPEVAQLCATTLTEFLQEPDQNLKYLGLVGFGSLLQSHPKVLSSGTHRPLILACLSDEDVTIRTRALELVRGLATKKNVEDLLTQLLRHVDSARSTYKTDLVDKVISICSAERRYTLLLPDDNTQGTGLFEWYVGKVLTRLAQTRGIAHVHGPLLQSQLQDVALRVPPVRPYCVQCMMELLQTSCGNDRTGVSYVVPQALPAAAWIVGEYAARIVDVETTLSQPFRTLIRLLVVPTTFHQGLAPRTQATFLQAAVKLWSTAASLPPNQVSNEELAASLATLHQHLPFWMDSLDVEVKERAFTARQLLVSLNLQAPPSLASLDSDEDDDEEDEEEEEENMLTGTTGKKKKDAASSTLVQATADRCRQAAPTLTYMYLPDPMMPVSLKAQRKERVALAAAAPDGVNLEEACQVKVFKSLLQEDEAAFPDSMGMESVSFTHQKPPPAATGAAAQRMQKGRSTDDARSSSPTSLASSSSMPMPSRPPSDDPFYLHSTTTTSNAAPTPLPTAAFTSTTSETEGESAAATTTTTPAANNAASLFGAIELGDDEDDGDDEADGKKKKRKKKKSKKKGMEDADLSVLGGGGGLNKNVALFVDDDDEDDDDDLLGMSKKKTVKDDLAKVDLSTPLREDETIKQREHYVVPDRPPSQEEAAPTTKKSKKKKKKEATASTTAASSSSKTKKAKESSKKTKAAKPTPNATGDLLGFGGVMAAAPAPTSNLLSMNTMDNASSNRIGSAFDDLLSLSAPPAPAPSLMAPMNAAPEASLLDLTAPVAAPAPMATSDAGGGGKSSSSTKRLWQRGTLVDSGGVGIWDSVSILFRSYKQGKKNTAANVTIKVVNLNADVVLPHVQVQLEGHGVLDLGKIEPGNAAESSTKVGPFAYGKNVLQCRVGVQVSSGAGAAAASFALLLPATMHLQPVAGLSLESVGQELTSSGVDWASSMVQRTVSGMDWETLSSLLLGFWRAHVVESSATATEIMGAASIGKDQGQVRLLLKWNPTTEQVKVDIKVKMTTSSNAQQWTQALAADGKQIAF